jgi:hypothetical protein
MIKIIQKIGFYKFYNLLYIHDLLFYPHMSSEIIQIVAYNNY